MTVIRQGFTAPRAWRTSLGFQRVLNGLIRLSVDGSLARGVSQTGYTDLNLAASPAFTLANEGNRPVYVPAGQIIPETGAVGLAGSRRDSTYGQVLQTVSGFKTSSGQLTVGLGGITRSGIIFNGSWTYSRSRDQTSAFGFGGGNTAGDPNAVEWATSSYQRLHSFLLTTMLPIGRSIELTAITRLNAGAPYTPIVGSDINGDGYRNDRAYVFGTSAADPNIAAGMSDLLASASPRVQDCLRKQTGKIAGRNSCTGPWQATLDLQLNWRPNFLGLSRKLSVSVVTVNLLGGIDQLVHGADNVHGWGQMARPDPTLLYVSGFDPNTNQFQYSVNGRFGATGTGATAVRAPFQIGIQARLQIGPDRQRQAMDAFRRGGGGGSGRPGGFAEGMVNRIREAMPNPAAGVLAMKDTLQLTMDQQEKLAVLADSFEATRDTFAARMQHEVDKAGANPDMARLMASVRPLFTEFMDTNRKAIDAVHHLLTDEQWGKVPDNLKGIFRRPGGPGQGGPGRRPDD